MRAPAVQKTRRVDLCPDHGLHGPGRGYRVRMTVYDLPAVVLPAEDGGHPKADRDLLHGVPELGTAVLYSDLIGKVGGLDPRDGVEGVALALTDLQRRAVHDLANRVEALRRGPEGVRQRNV